MFCWIVFYREPQEVGTRIQDDGCWEFAIKFLKGHEETDVPTFGLLLQA